MRKARLGAATVTALLALALAGPSWAGPQPAGTGAVFDDGGSGPGHRHQHGEPGGHLPPTQKNVEVIGRGLIQDGPGHVADVCVLGDHAYLAG